MLRPTGNGGGPHPPHLHLLSRVSTQSDAKYKNTQIQTHSLLSQPRAAEEMERELRNGQRMMKWTENEELDRECRNGKRMRKWRENEEIKRKWREYEEIERKWRESEDMEHETE